MRLHLIAVGTRLPGWLDAGYREYARRLPRECRLELTEIPLGRRAKNRSPGRAVAEEGERMLAALPAAAEAIALDVDGAAWSTETLANRLSDWLADGRDRAFLIGGPDGLAPAVRERTTARWSLSPLTLPHGLARVLVAEALYRAWSVTAGHPYHRG